MLWCRSSSCTWPTPVWNQRMEGTEIKFCRGATSQATRQQRGEWSLLPVPSLCHPYSCLEARSLCATQCTIPDVNFYSSSITLVQVGLDTSNSVFYFPLRTQSSNTNLIRSQRRRQESHKGIAASSFFCHATLTWLLLKREHSVCYWEHLCWTLPLQMETCLFLSSTGCTGCCAQHTDVNTGFLVWFPEKQPVKLLPFITSTHFDRYTELFNSSTFL